MESCKGTFGRVKAGNAMPLRLLFVLLCHFETCLPKLASLPFGLTAERRSWPNWVCASKLDEFVLLVTYITGILSVTFTYQAWRGFWCSPWQQAFLVWEAKSSMSSPKWRTRHPVTTHWAGKHTWVVKIAGEYGSLHPFLQGQAVLTAAFQSYRQPQLCFIADVPVTFLRARYKTLLWLDSIKSSLRFS